MNADCTHIQPVDVVEEQRGQWFVGSYDGEEMVNSTRRDLEYVISQHGAK